MEQKLKSIFKNLVILCIILFVFSISESICFSGYVTGSSGNAGNCLDGGGRLRVTSPVSTYAVKMNRSSSPGGKGYSFSGSIKAEYLGCRLVNGGALSYRNDYKSEAAYDAATECRYTPSGTDNWWVYSHIPAASETATGCKAKYENEYYKNWHPDQWSYGNDYIISKINTSINTPYSNSSTKVSYAMGGTPQTYYTYDRDPYPEQYMIYKNLNIKIMNTKTDVYEEINTVNDEDNISQEDSNSIKTSKNQIQGDDENLFLVNDNVNVDIDYKDYNPEELAGKSNEAWHYERWVYYDIGNFIWPIQGGTVTSCSKIQVFSNVQKSNGSYLDISDNCWVHYKLSNGKHFYRKFTELTADKIGSACDRVIDIIVPYDGITTSVKIVGEINYKINVSRTYVGTGVSGSASIGTAYTSTETRNVKLHLDTKNVSAYDNGSYGDAYWIDLKTGNLTVKKINRQAKEVYSTYKYLPNTYIKIVNVIREQCSNDNFWKYVGYDKDAYGNLRLVGYLTATEASKSIDGDPTNTGRRGIFKTDSKGEFTIQGLAIGEYRVVEVGTVHAGYNYAWANVRMNLKASQSSSSRTVYLRDKQTWVGVYGKVFEDKNNNSIYDSGDELLNNVIVRLKKDGVVLNDVDNFPLMQLLRDDREHNIGGNKINYELTQEWLIPKSIRDGPYNYQKVVLDYSRTDEHGEIEIQALSTVSYKNTMITRQDYIDVRKKSENGNNAIATSSKGKGEFGFIGLDVNDLIAGRYSIEFEYDGLIYREVNAIEYLPYNPGNNQYNTSNNSTNINFWNKDAYKNGSKAYEKSDKDDVKYNESYRPRGRDDFNSEFNTVEGINNSDNSYFTKAQNDYNSLVNSKLPNANINDEKIMSYSKTTKSSGNQYTDIQTFNNTLDDYKYGITADTANYDKNLFSKLFKYGDTEYIDYVNLGLRKRDEASVDLESDLVKVEVNVNGYKHVYQYGALKSDSNSSYNKTANYKALTNYNQNYQKDIYNSDIKLQTSTQNNLEMYLTYVLKIENRSEKVDISIDELCAYSKGLELVSVGKGINSNNNGLVWDSNLSYSTGYSNNGYDNEIVSLQNKIIPCNYGEHKDGSNYIPGTADNLSTDGKYIEIYLKFKVKQELLKDFSNRKSGVADNLQEQVHTVFEVRKYSLYKTKHEYTKEKDYPSAKPSYTPYAGVIKYINPQNVVPNLAFINNDPSKNPILDNFESDTAWGQPLTIKATLERALQGKIAVDESNFEEISEYSRDTLDEQYVIAKKYKENDYNPIETSGSSHQIASFKTRNGNGTLDVSDVGLPNVDVLLSSISTKYAYEDYNGNLSSSDTNRLKINYITTSVSERGYYGFDIYILKKNGSMLQINNTIEQYLKNYVGGDNVKINDIVDYITRYDLVNELLVNNQIKNDSITIYFKPIKYDVTGTPPGRPSGSYGYWKRLDAGEYAFPDVIPNVYRMYYCWGGQVIEENEYTTVEYKSTIVDEKNFSDQYNDLYNPDSTSATRRKTLSDRSWYTNNIYSNKNQAVDSYSYRQLIDNEIGQAQNAKDAIRDILELPNRKMVSYSRALEFKIESDDNTKEQWFIYDSTHNDYTNYYVNSINFMITQRPKSGIDVLKIPYSIKLTKPNGEVIVDQKVYYDNETGISKFDVMQIVPWPAGTKNITKSESLASTSLFIDDELRLNCIVEIVYSIEIINISEIDFADQDYYYYARINNPDTIVKMVSSEVYAGFSENTGSMYYSNYSGSSYTDDDILDNKQLVEINDISNNNSGKKWVRITKDYYEKEKSPVNNKIDNIHTTSGYDPYFIHADEIKQSNTRVNSDGTFNYINSDSSVHNNQVRQDWKKALLVDEFRNNKYLYKTESKLQENYQLDNKILIKSIEAFGNPIKPGEVDREFLITKSKITKTKNNTYAGFTDVASAYTTRNSISSFYYGNPIRYENSNFKASARHIQILPPTGKNKNYAIYLITTITTLGAIGLGLFVLVKKNKKLE